METIFFGLLTSIGAGAAADSYSRAKRHVIANILGVIGIVGYVVAVTGMA